MAKQKQNGKQSSKRNRTTRTVPTNITTPETSAANITTAAPTAPPLAERLDMAAAAALLALAGVKTADARTAGVIAEMLAAGNAGKTAVAVAAETLALAIRRARDAKAADTSAARAAGKLWRSLVESVAARRIGWSEYKAAYRAE